MGVAVADYDNDGFDDLYVTLGRDSGRSNAGAVKKRPAYVRGHV
jgi:hypothetical protein